jgi:pyruvyltransferase
MVNNLKWMKCNNFGDALNPHLFEYLSGTKPHHVKNNYSGKCYIMVGSILNWSKGDNICWGGGFAQDCGNINLRGEILHVRGPMSREVVLKNNLSCQDDYYGDPAILISQYYKPNIDKKYKLGVMPHIIDYHDITINNPDILKIDLNKDYKSVINDMLSCEKIISSSLHGLIVADAYQIPSLWVEFSDKVIGGGFKFYDYYKSIGVETPKRIDLRNNKTISDLNILTNIEQYDNLHLVDDLIKNCPFKK